MIPLRRRKRKKIVQVSDEKLLEKVIYEDVIYEVIYEDVIYENVIMKRTLQMYYVGVD